MTKHRLKYLRNEAVEDITAQRIREYEAKVGGTVTLPVPIEEIVEQVLGLDFDWDVIEEKLGEQILGGLDATNRKILINEAHADLFEQKPGPRRTQTLWCWWALTWSSSSLPARVPSADPPLPCPTTRLLQHTARCGYRSPTISNSRACCAI